MAKFNRAELRRELEQLSPSELGMIEEQLRPLALDEDEGEELFLDRLAPEPTTEPREGVGFTDPDFLSTAASNLPFSLAERGRELEGVARHPFDLLETLGKLGAGGLDVFAEQFGSDPTENSQLARQFATEFKESTINPGRVARDPTAPIANIAGLLAPFAPKGSMLAKIGTFAADPAAGTVGAVARGAVKAGAAGTRAGGRALSATLPKVNPLIAEGIGISTGRGGQRSRAAINAGRTGEGPAFREALNTSTTGRLGQTVQREVRGELGTLGDAKREFLRGQEGSIPIDDLKEVLVRDLTGRGDPGPLSDLGVKLTPDPAGSITIRGSGFDEAGRGTVGDFGSERFRIEVPEAMSQDAPKLETALRAILEEDSFVSVERLDDLKQALDNAPLPSGSAKAQRAITEVRQGIRRKLGEVKGFDEVSDPLRQAFQTQEGVTARLGLQEGALAEVGEVAPQAVGKAMARAFNKGDDTAERMLGLEMADLDIPSQPIKTRAAAIGFKDLTPTDLIGRQQFFQAVGPILGLAGGAAALAAGGSALLALPVIAVAFIPKFAGRALVRLGEAEAGAIQNLAQKMVGQAEAIGVDVTKGMTMADLVERLEEARNENTTDQPRTLLGRGLSATNSR